MKTIENVIPFGNFTPGDQLVIPAEAEFDHYYFREVAEKPPTPTPTPVANTPGVEAEKTAELTDPENQVKD